MYLLFYLGRSGGRGFRDYPGHGQQRLLVRAHPRPRLSCGLRRRRIRRRIDLPETEYFRIPIDNMLICLKNAWLHLAVIVRQSLSCSNHCLPSDMPMQLDAKDKAILFSENKINLLPKGLVQKQLHIAFKSNFTA